MWNKRDETGTPNPAPTPQAPAPTGMSAVPPRQVTAATKQPATIGPSMTIKGEIRAKEELLVEGEVEGLLESEWVDSGTGHPRKYYKLTDAGRRRVKEMNRAWTEFSEKLNSILDTSGMKR